MKKSLVLALAMLMVLSAVFAACGPKKKPTPATTPGTSDINPNPYDDWTPDEDLTALDYDNAPIHFLQATYKQTEFYASATDAISGSVLSKSVFNRNRKVQDDLDVYFDFQTVQMSDAQNIGPWKDRLNQAMTGGSEQLTHIAANPIYYCTSFILEGYYTDFGKIENSKINLEKKYWSQSFNEASVINDHTYFVVGELCTSVLDRMEVVFVNRSVANKYFPEENIDFFEMVYERDWTYANMLTLVNKVGNGLDTGTFGLALARNSYSIDGFLAGLACDLVKRNDNEFSINLNSSHNDDIVTALRKLYTENESVDSSGDTAFRNGNAMLNIAQMSNAARYSEQSVRFITLPLPMWDDEQDDYRIIPHDQFSALSIASNVPKSQLTMLTAVLEYMCYVSHSTTYPAVYETTYQVRYNSAEDEDSLENSRMFDYITAHINFTTGYVYSNVLGDVKNIPRYLIYDPSIKKDVNINSSIETTLKTYQERAEQKLTAFLELIYT